MNQKTILFTTRLSTVLMVIAVCLIFQCFAVRMARATDSPNQPSSVVKLIFIHHSTGQNWLDDNNGGLGIALRENNYFVSDTNYGWGPNSIGDSTDIPDWLTWFGSENTTTYMTALYNESGTHSSYSRGTLSDPGGENEIIMFKSCFPNSDLWGTPDDLPSPPDYPLTVGNAKYVYNQLLLYFEAHPDKLFVVITAPPLIDGTHAANARAFNQWLMNDWLSQNNYTLKNVAIFDLYNVLTGPDNHHRFNNNAVEHIFTQGMNTLYYPTGGDDHPSQTGNIKATNEFVTLLNVFYHRWKSDIIPPTATTGMSTHVTTGSATLNGDVNPNGLSTTYYFEWGATTSYGNTIPSTAASVGSGTENVHVSADITGLNPGTIYHYRIVAVSSAGTSYGSDRIIEKAHGQPFLMLLLE